MIISQKTGKAKFREIPFLHFLIFAVPTPKPTGEGMKKCRYKCSPGAGWGTCPIAPGRRGGHPPEDTSNPTPLNPTSYTTHRRNNRDPFSPWK